MNVIGLLTLVLACVVPLRLLAYPEVTDLVVHDLVSNVLVGVGVAFGLGLVLPGPAEPAQPAPRYEVLPPLTAAIVLALGAFLVWVFEPPAPGAVLIGAIITLRADLHPGFQVARDRIIGAIVGGVLAVVAATVMGLAPVLPTLFLVLMVVSWPLALRIVQDGPWQGAAVKSLYALGILVGEGFSPLFEDTGERLGYPHRRRIHRADVRHGRNRTAGPAKSTRSPAGSILNFANVPERKEKGLPCSGNPFRDPRR